MQPMHKVPTMIKATGTRADGTPVLIIGVSEANVQEMKKGRPLRCDGSEVNLDIDVVVIYGETEESLVDDLRSIGTQGLPD